MLYCPIICLYRRRKYKDETTRLNQQLKSVSVGSKATDKQADRLQKEIEKLRWVALHWGELGVGGLTCSGVGRGSSGCVAVEGDWELGLLGSRWLVVSSICGRRVGEWVTKVLQQVQSAPCCADLTRTQHPESLSRVVLTERQPDK